MMVSLQRQRIMDCLVESDPDELVGILQISSRELILAFPDLVEKYIEDECDVEDDEEADIY